MTHLVIIESNPLISELFALSALKRFFYLKAITPARDESLARDESQARDESPVRDESRKVTEDRVKNRKLGSDNAAENSTNTDLMKWRIAKWVIVTFIIVAVASVIALVVVVGTSITNNVNTTTSKPSIVPN